MTPFPRCLALNTLLLAPVFAACSEPPTCTQDIRPAIMVEIRDSVSDEYLAVVPRGAVRDAGFEDSLKVAGETLEIPPRVATMTAADERPGTYIVELEADGYLLWDTSNVQVFRDDCHVITEEFIARLQPQ